MRSMSLAIQLSCASISSVHALSFLFGSHTGFEATVIGSLTGSRLLSEAFLLGAADDPRQIGDRSCLP